jgi:diaminohydroxyphosphoribosylaminopyrimidine deaminase / 5-amino-6-(5-phosphoribosylamino)uracil reductase
VIADDPLLTSRLPGLESRSPIRVVFDSSLRMSAFTQLVTTARETPVWVVTEHSASHDAERSLAPHGVEIIRSGIDDAGIDIAKALTELSRRGITRLMVEGGPVLANSFLQAGLVDEAVIFTSPNNLGEDAVPALPGPVDQVLNAAGLGLSEHHQAGVDLMQIYRRA